MWELKFLSWGVSLARLQPCDVFQSGSGPGELASVFVTCVVTSVNWASAADCPVGFRTDCFSWGGGSEAPLVFEKTPRCKNHLNPRGDASVAGHPRDAVPSGGAPGTFEAAAGQAQAELVGGREGPRSPWGSVSVSRCFLVAGCGQMCSTQRHAPFSCFGSRSSGRGCEKSQLTRPFAPTALRGNPAVRRRGRLVLLVKHPEFQA